MKINGQSQVKKMSIILSLSLWISTFSLYLGSPSLSLYVGSSFTLHVVIYTILLQLNKIKLQQMKNDLQVIFNKLKPIKDNINPTTLVSRVMPCNMHFNTKHIQHNSLIYIKLINIMIRTNYMVNQFGVKGQCPLQGPRSNTPIGVQGVAPLAGFGGSAPGWV